MKMKTKIEGLFEIKPLRLLRQTEGVDFQIVPTTGASSIDRVIHVPGARSPGAVGEVEHPWYYHPDQEDNILVLYGRRWIELYTKEHGIYEFEMTADKVILNGEVICEEPAVLFWPTHVFHRVKSCKKEGSRSVNFAFHKKDFDIQTNFSIYNLNTETGEFSILREGRLDQPESH